MYNQTEAILSQYELEIQQMTKGRGCYVCETNQGTKLLCPFRGSKEKGEGISLYLTRLRAHGYPAECVVHNCRGEAVTEDEVTGERFWLKDAILGRELSTAHFGEMIEAAGRLAQYHNVAATSGVGMVGIGQMDVVENCVRHTRELLKVKNYIRSKKRKQEFEQLYLCHFASMYETAERSCALLEEPSDVLQQSLVCHGDCNQHNIVWSEDGWHLVHYETVVRSWPIWDLATYLRKMMEKNAWNVQLGAAIMEAYCKERPLCLPELKKLCGLMLFPEKFWKVANHYMSSNKAWIPEKDLEKMKKVIEQEQERLKFVENLFSIAR